MVINVALLHIIFFLKRCNCIYYCITQWRAIIKFYFYTCETFPINRMDGSFEKANCNPNGTVNGQNLFEILWLKNCLRSFKRRKKGFSHSLLFTLIRYSVAPFCVPLVVVELKDGCSSWRQIAHLSHAIECISSRQERHQNSSVRFVCV